jgi:hypothetical protein
LPPAAKKSIPPVSSVMLTTHNKEPQMNANEDHIMVESIDDCEFSIFAVGFVCWGFVSYPQLQI